MSNKTKEMDGYIRDLNHPLEAEIVLIRSIILAADPAITEHIKWNAPSFSYNGEDRITFRLNPKVGIQLVFHRGAKVKDAKGFVFQDPAGILEWPAKDRALANFMDVKEVKAKKAALTDIVKRWVKVNA